MPHEMLMPYFQHPHSGIMKPTPIILTNLITFLCFLCIVQPSAAQIIGCNGDGINCHTNNDNPIGICAPEVTRNGIGVTSFDSNITSAGPLTWTLTVIDDASSGGPYTERSFWFGTPPSFNASDISSFGGCAIPLSNLTSALQVPQGFTDFSDFACSTLLGERCIQDLITLVHGELIHIVQNGTIGDHLNPCEMIAEILNSSPFPDTCDEIFTTDVPLSQEMLFQTGWDIVSPNGFGYQLQDGCDVTTGGPDYLLNLGPRDIRNGEVDTEPIKLFKNGTTPLFTMFYNEPWNDFSTGPAPFLEIPEVHLHCLTVVQTPEQLSGAPRSEGSLGNPGTVWLAVASFIWMVMLGRAQP